MARNDAGARARSPRRGLAASPVTQVLVEQSLIGWKEIEYEVHPRRRRHLHRRLQHGEHRPDGRPHRRLDRGRAQPDALRPRVPDAADGGHQDHPRARHRGRLQRPVRARSALAAVLRDRGQPARQPLLGAGLEGDRLPDRAGLGQDRHRQAAGRDPERRHPATTAAFEPALDYLVVKIPRWPVRQVRHRRPGARHADEGDRRGHGDRPLLRGRASEGVRSLEFRGRNLLWEEPSWSGPGGSTRSGS